MDTDKKRIQMHQRFNPRAPAFSGGWNSTCLDRCDERVQRSLGAAEKHPRVVLVEKKIFDAGIVKGRESALNPPSGPRSVFRA